MSMIHLTCIAPVNIAVVKYWGKRDEKLILPVNDSISGTLSMDQLHTKTTIAISSTFDSNKFWLNDEECPIDESPRMKACITALKELATQKNPDNEYLKYKIHVCSKNNFPTACGLASSAAGYACFVYTLANLYGLEDAELTALARQGSGSACRSLHGGFVHWQKGSCDSGRDSIAVQLADENHWDDMRVLILVVSDKKKSVASSKGMANSVKTSELLKYRIERCVDEHVVRMKKAIADRDFETFAEITMRESNQFHSVCLDSYPPIAYMNDVSHKIAEIVHKFNKNRKAAKVAYTFDAGPNACLYMMQSEVSIFISVLNVMFPTDLAITPTYIRGIPVKYRVLDDDKMLEITKRPYDRDLVKYIIHTKLGSGPKKLEADQTLLDDIGLPKI